MRVIEAARLVTTGSLTLATLWAITTTPERVLVALLLGQTDQLPPRARTPALAWAALNEQQRQILLDHAPAAVLARLPADPAGPTPRPAPSHAGAAQGG